MQEPPTGPAPAPPGAAIEISGLGHRFGDLEVLRGVDLEVAAGEVVAIVGASGCGKSTLLELIAGLAEPTAGAIAVAGERSAPGRITTCAWMPQRDLLLPWRRAVDNAALGLRVGGTDPAEARERAAAMLDRLGVGEFAGSFPDQLSGGMRQRVAFIRTLVSGKPVLLLDEPFAALDAITRAELQEWLAPVLAETGATVLLVTHDVEEAIYLADRVLVLSPRPGRITAGLDGARGAAGDRTEVVSSRSFNQRREEVLDLLGPGVDHT